MLALVSVAIFDLNAVIASCSPKCRIHNKTMRVSFTIIIVSCNGMSKMQIMDYLPHYMPKLIVSRSSEFCKSK